MGVQLGDGDIINELQKYNYQTFFVMRKNSSDIADNALVKN